MAGKDIGKIALTAVLAVFSPLAFTLSGAQEGTNRSTNVSQTASYTVVAEGLAGPRGLVFGFSGELYVAEQSGVSGNMLSDVLGDIQIYDPA